MGIYTKEEQFKLIDEGWRNIKKIDNQYEEVCLEAVKQNGEVIKKSKIELQRCAFMLFK